MKVKHFLSVLLVLCIIIETGFLSTSVLAISIEDTVKNSSKEEHSELSNKLQMENLISGKDYVENEIILCGRNNEFEDEISKYEEEYDLTLEYCLTSDDADDENDRMSTYLLSTNEISANITDIIEDLQKDDSVIYAQPNFIYSYENMDDSKVSIVNKNRIKNYINSQEDMFLTLFNQSSNWKANGGSNILIAVIDSGIDLSHPTLANALWSNNGIYGYNFTNPENIRPIVLENNDEYKKDHYEHGTAVAGIIGMQRNSTDGYTCRGIAPSSKIIDLQISDNDIKPTTLAVIAALEKAEELYRFPNKYME